MPFGDAAREESRVGQRQWQSGQRSMAARGQPYLQGGGWVSSVRARPEEPGSPIAFLPFTEPPQLPLEPNLDLGIWQGGVKSGRHAGPSSNLTSMT